jgi:ACR3 family arsenite transporter
LHRHYINTSLARVQAIIGFDITIDPPKSAKDCAAIVEITIAPKDVNLQPVSLVALLATLVLLFGFQGKEIVRQPLIILLLAIPIVIQVYLNAGIAYWLNRALGVPHSVACPSALIGASNFFELAVAAAIALFGFRSGAALATVVGVLVEVPVMLSVVRIVVLTRGWYGRGSIV